MFARVFALLPLAVLVSATHLEARGQCNTGSINCCNSVQSLSSAQNTLSQFNLLSAATAAGGQVGFNCSPISLVGGNTCEQQPVCCTGNDFNGLVNIGCSPINVNA
ncbi:hydrophobin, partial [Butyriboletus roseoflavus]